MASIKGGSGQSSISRKAQQDYHQKEQTLIKKHRRELKNQQEDHQTKLRNVQEKHGESMDKLRDKSRGETRRRDAQYQKNIQEMRDLHREQLRKVAETSEKNLETLDRTRKGEFNKMQTISERQKALLRSRHKGDLDHLQERFNKFADTTRKEQEVARKKITSRLNQANDDRINHVIETQGQKVAATQTKLESLRRGKEKEIDRLRQALVSQKNDLSNRHLGQIRVEQDRQEQRMQGRQVSFDNSLGQMKQKYSEAINEEKGRSEKYRADLKETVEGRQQQTTAALERRVAELRLANTAGFQNLKKQYETEKQNLIHSYEQKRKNMEVQREKTLESFNRTGGRDNMKVREEFEDKFRRNNMFHLQKVEDLERRQAEQLQSLIMDAEQKQNVTEKRANKRVEVLTDKTATERRERENYFKNAIQESRRGFEEQLKDQRIKHAAEKQDMVRRFRESMVKSEDAHSAKLYRKVSFYEKQIEEINDRNLREIRSMQQQHKRLLEQEQRQSELEKETLKLQYTDKVDQLQKTSHDEVARINRSHQEELQRLAIATRKS